MAPVLLAIRDTAVRESLGLLLRDEAGYPVAEADSGITTLTALLTSPHPLVVLLDTHLEGHDAVEYLLRLAAADGPARRHRYVVCTTDDPMRLPPSLFELITTLGASLLAMPCSIDTVLYTVAHLQALLPTAEAA